MDRLIDIVISNEEQEYDDEEKRAIREGKEFHDDKPPDKAAAERSYSNYENMSIEELFRNQQAQFGYNSTIHPYSYEKREAAYEEIERILEAFPDDPTWTPRILSQLSAFYQLLFVQSSRRFSAAR